MYPLSFFKVQRKKRTTSVQLLFSSTHLLKSESLYLINLKLEMCVSVSVTP